MADYTIKDMLEAAGIKPSQASWKRLVAAGFSLDEPVSALQEPDSNHARLRKLEEIGATESDYKNWLKGQNAINVDAGLKGKEPMPNIFGAKGITRSLELKGAKQARKSAKPAAIPEGKITLKIITESIAEIPDANVRAAVAFNSLVPLRPVEVAKLKIDDIDFETGGFSYTDDRGTKVRAKLDLPEMALGILEEQANKARAAGHQNLFYNETMTKGAKPDSAFVKRMTDAVNAPGGLRDKMKPYEKAMGRPIKGVSDLRKLIPSIIANELGYAKETSAIMGHTSLDAIAGEMEGITAKHYVTGIITEEGSKSKQALRALQNAYADVLDLPNVNSLAGAMNLDVPRLTATGAPQIVVAKKGGSLAVKDTVKGEVTPEVRADIEAQREQATAIARQRAAEAEKATLETKLATAEEMAKPENIEKLKQAKKAELQMKQIEQEATAQAKAEIAAEKGAVEIDSDTKSKMSGLADFLDNIGKGLKAVAPVIPGVGMYFSGKAKAGEAEQLIEEGRSPVGAYASKAAEFAYEEFTVPGEAAAIAKSLGEVQPATAEEATTDPYSFTESEVGTIKESQGTEAEDAEKLRNFLEQDLIQP